jgi:dihydrofolate synthase/folylpolyglutamate synthase
VEFLLGRIDYERADLMPSGGQGLKLDRMRQLLTRLGNPHVAIPIIHVAGTKGKGSTAATIAAVLSAAGCRTGLFTSPHLERMEQRIAVDGQSCPSDEFADLLEQIRPVVAAMDRAAAASAEGESGPTYFEITTALAMLQFARRKVDAAVFEVGLGGRLDATNVCWPQVAVITSISFDHTRQLGDTLAAIAREKAGIIKPGVPVVSGVVDEEPREVIREVCRQRGCRLVELRRDFDFRYQPPQHLEQAAAAGKLDFHCRVGDATLSFENLSLSLLGQHQAANTAVALATLAELGRAGWKIPQEAIRKALAEMVWPARVEVVARRPVVILDAAHNTASIAALLRTLDESFCVARRLLIFATSKDKDLRGMLGLLLGRFDEVFFTRYLNNPRAVPPEELQALSFELTGRRPAVHAEPAAAWEAARAQAAGDDLICITGSFFLAADLRRILAAGAH